jgi:hypothetical protein
MSKRTTWEGVVIYIVRTLINKQQEQMKNMSKNRKEKQFEQEEQHVKE